MELSAEHGGHGDAGGHDVPMAAQLSQAQIIERQAYSIDKLKRQAEKSSEYKRLTKVKLKEAAQRLREYRQRVEALIQEVADGKRALQAQKEAAAFSSASERGRGAARGRSRGRPGAVRTVDAAVSAAVSTREMAVQTDMPQRRTTDSQAQTQLSGEVQLVPRKAVGCAAQTAVGTTDQQQETDTKPAVSRKRRRSFHQDGDLARQAEAAQLTPQISRRPVEEGLLSLGIDAGVQTAARNQLEPFALSKSPLKMASMPFTNKTSAAIDAELALSDSEDEGTSGLGSALTLSIEDQASLPLGVLGVEEKTSASSQPIALDVGVSCEIDRELEMSSDDDDEPKEASSAPSKAATVQVDAPNRDNSLHASIDAEIDAELATSESETEQDEVSKAGEITGKKIESSSSSSDSSDSDSSASSDAGSDAADDTAMDGIVDEIEFDLAGQGGAAVEEQAMSVVPITSSIDQPGVGVQEQSELGNDEAKEVASTSTSATGTGDNHVPSSQMDVKVPDPMASVEKESGEPEAVKNTEQAGSAWSRAFRAPTASQGDPTLAVTSLKEPVSMPISSATNENPNPKVMTRDLLQSDRDSASIGMKKARQNRSEVTEGISSRTQRPDAAVAQEDAPIVVPEKADRSISEEIECRPAETKISGSPSSEAVVLSESSGPCPFPDVKVSPKVGTTQTPSTGSTVGGDSKKVKAVSSSEKSPPAKKQKLGADTSVPSIPAPEVPVPEISPGPATSTTSMSKDAGHAIGESRPRELYLNRALNAFKRDIARGKNEAIDEEFVRRTMSSLVRCSAKFVTTYPDHVTKLCQVLGQKYRDFHVSPIMMVHGTVRVLRTPRSRHILGNESVELSRLCHRVLLACDGGDQATRQRFGGTADEVMHLSSELDECLSHLEGLLVSERFDLGSQLSESANLGQTQQQLVSKKRSTLSNDKAFLTHICAFHTLVCRSFELLPRSRVLLVDVIKSNPDFRGLAMAEVMLEISPEIMTREFDEHCQELRMPLKDTLVYALTVISSAAGRKQQVFRGDASATLLHRISERIQMPEVMEVDAEDEQFREAFMEGLWTQLATPCQDAGAESAQVERYELFKSLELCTAVHELAFVAQTFSLDRLQDQFSASNFAGKADVLVAAGHIALASAEKKRKASSHELSSYKEEYVNRVLAWLPELLLPEKKGETSSSDDKLQLQLRCVWMCVDLLLASSALGANLRRLTLSIVLKWFDTRTSEGVTGFPADFLRRLRLAVVCSRPPAAKVRRNATSWKRSGARGRISELERGANKKGRGCLARGLSMVLSSGETDEPQDAAEQTPSDEQRVSVLGDEVAPQEEAPHGAVESGGVPSEKTAVVSGEEDPPADDHPNRTPADGETNAKDGATAGSCEGEVSVEEREMLGVVALESIMVETTVAAVDGGKPDKDTGSAPSAGSPGSPSSAGGSPRRGTVNSKDFKAMARMAQVTARLDRLGEGKKSVFQAKMRDIGALGIGMQLYFMLTKYVSVAFLIMGVMALPAIVLNTVGHGITSNMVDPLQLAYSSLGNQGINSETAANPRLCLPVGDIDCTWKTVNTPFTSEPTTVTWIVTVSDCLYSLVFLCFVLFYSYRSRKAIDAYKKEHLTPARYAVCVRGLPRDASEKEIVQHFNTLCDPTKEEEYSRLWFGCCWGKRHKPRHSLSRKASNMSIVSNVDHLEGTTTITKELYLNTWIAEVSIAHPTGGLLRTFLSMEALTQSISETELLIRTLKNEKSLAPETFKSRDEKLIHRSYKKLERLVERLEKAKKKIAMLKQVLPPDTSRATKKMQQRRGSGTSREKLAAAAKAAKAATTKTKLPFDWEACECAFVVFNNLESQRRCLQDYRESTRWLARKWQPKHLRFRDGAFPLIVTPAPEPANILWENLEVTNRGRFYRQCVTNCVTFILLLLSCVIISAAQSTQQQFQSKMPPSGLCDQSLPAVYFASEDFSTTASGQKITWELEWNKTAVCTLGSGGEARYNIKYSNGIYSDLDNERLSTGKAYPSPVRCLDPCISETSNQECNTLPCFYYDDLVLGQGKLCEVYEASHVMYCYCSAALASSITELGYVEGPKQLWNNVPCRGFITDYLSKNMFIVLAAAVVVLVNVLLNTIVRRFADFERHTSGSTKTLTVTLRMFGAQFLNTAVIVVIVNASLGLSSVPVANELLKGEYRDFERGWYPTVGMGIATTMLLNALMPQVTLFMRMFVISPLTRCIKRRSIRTQQQMDRLYAGPTFDISARYPMVLNSIFVTMVFCGGSPVLLFIAALTAAGTYWFDKLSILHLYSVKTSYDEHLGEVAMRVLPWTLVLHLGFSAWMYGNTKLLQSTMVNVRWIVQSLGLSSILTANPDATSEELYALLMEKVERFDMLGQYGLVAKLVHSHVMLMFVLCMGLTLSLVLLSFFGGVVVPVLTQTLEFVKQVLQLLLSCLPCNGSSGHKASTKKRKQQPGLVLPEFTEPFRMSVSRRYRPDRLLGFEKTIVDDQAELICVWREDFIDRNGLERVVGERKRTWESMHTPVKSYAIEANDRYRLAVEEIAATWQLMCKMRGPTPVKLGKVTPQTQVGGHEQALQVVEAITASEPVSVAVASATTESEKAPVAPSTEFLPSNDGTGDSGEGGEAEVSADCTAGVATQEERASLAAEGRMEHEEQQLSGEETLKYEKEAGVAENSHAAQEGEQASGSPVPSDEDMGHDAEVEASDDIDPGAGTTGTSSAATK